MISDNRQYIAIQAWAVLAPAAMIALLTIGINLTGDAIARSPGRSYVPQDRAECGDRADARTGGGGGGSSLGLTTGDPVVEDVSFSVGAGQILGLVGESAAARPPPRWPCSATRVAASSCAAAASASAASRSWVRASATSATCAARSSPTCRRTPAAPSTRRCGWATR
jgi:hypothetical protein